MRRKRVEEKPCIVQTFNYKIEHGRLTRSRTTDLWSVINLSSVVGSRVECTEWLRKE
jgi:hypothetical protein